MYKQLEKDLYLCEEFGIKPNELFFIKLLIPDPSKSASECVNHQRKMASRFQKLQGITPADVRKLEKMKLIIHSDPGNDTLLYSDFEVAPKLMKYFVDIQPISFTQELIETYPFEITQDGKTFAAKSISAEEISHIYMANINSDENEHKEVMKDLKYAIKQNLLRVGVKKFIEMRYWEHYRALRKSDTTKSDFYGKLG